MSFIADAESSEIKRKRTGDNVMTQEELNKLDFKIALQNALKAKFGDNLAKIEHDTFRKANTAMEGMILKFKNSELAPVIYPDELYKNYKNGATVDSIADWTAASCRKLHVNVPEFTPESLEKNLYTVVINKSRNEELLRTAPHRIIAGNLAEVARYRVSSEGTKEASFLITNQHCRYLHMMDDEIMDIAHRNTENQKYRLQNLFQATFSMLSDDELKETFDEEYSDDGVMILTNMKGIDGANVITSQRIMKEVSEQLDSSFYILPSSRHELIIVPDRCMIEPKYMTEMVRDINKTLDAKDFLSDNIYHYNAQKMMLSMVSEVPDKEEKLLEIKERKCAMKH